MQSIGFIFVLGYASSAFLGTIVASLGDRYGHKVNCVLYGYSRKRLLCVVSSRRSDAVFRESFRGGFVTLCCLVRSRRGRLLSAIAKNSQEEFSETVRIGDVF